jgi:hypothetical protein
MNQMNQQHTESPEMLSRMGYSLAKDAGQFRKGIELCLKALSLEPRNCDHYLYLVSIRKPQFEPHWTSGHCW